MAGNREEHQGVDPADDALALRRLSDAVERMAARIPRTEERATLAPPASVDIPTLHGSETILLVEDEAQLRTVAREVLRRHGYRVLEAHDGDEALRLCEFERAPIDLVLTDVVMPGMSGRELVERMEGLLRNVRVLYMSGYTADAISLHRVLDPGVSLLQKPITPDSLLRKVRELLNSAR